MIIVRLSGGIGNQMFQYAFGRKLSLIHNTKLFLDLIEYEPVTQARNNLLGLGIRNYELGCFNIEADITHDSLRDRFYPSNYIFSRILSKAYKVFFSYKVVNERQIGYDSEIYSFVNKRCYLNGYWQSPLYFDDIRKVLMADFTFFLSNERNKDLENLIENSNSVSIHVRRGDYIANDIVNSIHGALSISYYQKGIAELRNSVTNPEYFIFSDDIEWCRKNFSWLEHTHYVEGTGLSSHYDLYLMSKCKHNIIANSTYSWWGAYLNMNKQKIVISPSQWYANVNMNQLISSIYCNGWRII